MLSNFSEVNQLRSVSNNEDNVAINISLKSGKDKFWFGEIGGGAGNNDRFIAAPKSFLLFQRIEYESFIKFQ